MVIDTQPKASDRVQYAFFYLNPNTGPHYTGPRTCHPATVEGCLREIANESRFPQNSLAWGGVWFDMGLIAQADHTPPAEAYDGFAPIAHPASGNLMAVLLRVRTLYKAEQQW